MLVSQLRGDGQGALKDNADAQLPRLVDESLLRFAQASEGDTGAQDVVNWPCSLDQSLQSGSCDADSSAFAPKQQPCATCGGTGSSQARVPPTLFIDQLLSRNCSHPLPEPGAAAGAIRAVLHMTGCSNCCTHRGRSWQDEAGAAGVVEQLAAALAAQQHAAEQPVQSKQALAEALQALLFVCCEHAGNAQRLLLADGWQLLLKQSAGAALDADTSPLWCLVLGIAADAAASANSSLQQQQLVASLLALKSIAQQQLTAAVGADVSSSSGGQQQSATAVLWAIGKVAGCLVQSGSLASSNGSECQLVLHSLLAEVVLPCLASVMQAEAALCNVTESAQQEQQLLWLAQQCLACCAVLVSAMSSAAAVAEESIQQLRVLLHAAADRCATLTGCNSSSASALAAQVQESAGALLQWLSHKGSSPSSDVAINSSDQLGLQHMPPLVPQAPACRVLSALQQQHNKSSGGSSGAVELPVQEVVAGATATIEVVYAGSQAGKDSCDEKDSTPSSDRRCSEHSDDTCLLEERDAPASSQVQGQQLDLQNAAGDRQQQQQQEHHERRAADLLSDGAMLPPLAAQTHFQQQLPSYPLVTDPAEQCSVPQRSSSSTKACGDGRTDSSSSSYRGDSSNSGGDNGGTDGHDQAGGGAEGGSTGSGSGDSGAPGGSGSGNSGSNGDDDDRKDFDNKQHNGITPATESSDAASGSNEAGSPTSPASAVAAESEQAAPALIATASSGVGCSASDPVVVPAPASLGTGQGLRLYASPASLLSASAAAEVQRRASQSGAFHGSGLGPAGLLGTGLQGTSQLSDLLSPSGPLTAPGTPAGASVGTVNDMASPAFAFPANLSQLTVPSQPHFGGSGGGSLAEALLSPMSLAGHSLQQLGGLGGLGAPTTPPAGGGGGFPGFGVGSSPLAGAVAAAAATYRRASESSGFGRPYTSRHSAGGWGGLRVPAPQQQRQLAPHLQQDLLQQQHGGGVLAGSWPNAASGAGMTALDQHLKQLQLQQQQGLAAATDAGLPPLLPAAAGGHNVLPAAARPSCPAAAPALLSPAASGGHAGVLGSVGSGSSSTCMPLERTTLSGHLSSHLHMLNPGLMGLIGSSDPNLGAIGTQLSGPTDHLMTWLSNDEYTRAGSASANSSGVISAAAAADFAGSGAAAMQTAAVPSSSDAAAIEPHEQVGTAGDVDAQKQQQTVKADLDVSSGGNVVPAADATQPRTRDQGLPPPSAPSGCKVTEGNCGPGTAAASGCKVTEGNCGPGTAAASGCKVTEGNCGPGTAAASAEAAGTPGGAAAARTPAAGALLHVASISSGSSISRAGSMGSAGGSMAHSYSGDSLGSDADLEAMRLSSASFAAALAEAEAIAANVAASMARQQLLQQDVAAAKSEQGAATQEMEGVPVQNKFEEPAISPPVEGSGAAYDPAELTKGQPSRHLWLGNLHQRLPRSVLRGVFERYGPVDDVVTFPGRMYAFVNFKEPADAAKAAEAVQDKEVPVLSGARRLVVKFRPSRRALGKVAEAMVPGLVEPGRSGSNSSSSSNAGSSAGSAAGSQNNLEAAAAAPTATVAEGPPGVGVTTSRSSSSSSLAWLTAAAASGGATMGASTAIEAAVEPEGASAAAADASVDPGGLLGREGLQHQRLLHLPPGLSAATAAAAATGSVASEEVPDTTAATDQGLQPTSSGSLAAAAAAAAAAAGGPSNMRSAAAAAAAVAAAAAAVANSSTDSNAATAAHVAAAAAALAAVDAGLPQGPSLGSGEPSGTDDGDIPEGKPSRHLWLGNIPLKPNRAAMEALFSRFGPLESVRVFPGKTFAFVNFVHAAHAIQAKAALDAQPSPHITGPKPLVIRFQKDTAAVPPPGSAARAVDLAAARARKATVPRTSLTGGLLGSSAGGSLGALGVEEELVPEPAVNLSNKLNPNNIHYDRELAARYKRMNKTEKEALWAQDRALQQLEHHPAAASLLSAAAAAAAAAAVGQHTPGMMFDNTLHQHQGGAAGAASSIYGQLMSTNPQLAAAATALAQAQAHGGANAAAAAVAGLFQQAQAGMQGAAAWSSPATNVYQQMAAALNANMAPNSAATAHLAASGLESLLGRLGGFGGGSAGQLGATGAAAGLQQYLAATGGLNNTLMGQANQAALLQQMGGSSYSMQRQHEPHVAAAAAALQMQGGRNPAALAALGLDPSMLQSQMGQGLPPHMGGVGLGGMHAGQQNTPGASTAGATAGLSSLLGGGGFATGNTGNTPGMGHAGTPHAGAVPRRSYPGAAPGSWDLGGGDAAGVSEFGGVGDGSGRPQLGFRASTTGAGLLGAGGGGSGVAGLGPIGPSSASSAASRDAMAATVASALGDLGQQRQYAQQQYGSQQQAQQSQQVGLAGWGGMAGRGNAAGGGHQWPPHLLCSLTRQVMADPVMAADGHTYERAAITDWLRLRDVSPVTGEPLSSAVLQPNHQLRQAIGTELMKMQGGGSFL